MDGSFVSEYVYGYLYGSVEEQYALLTQSMVKNTVQNKIYELFLSVNNMLELLIESFLYVQCEYTSVWAAKGDTEKAEKIKLERERFGIIYKGQSRSIQNANIDCVTKCKLNTVYWKEDGTCVWMPFEQICNDLKKIL